MIKTNEYFDGKVKSLTLEAEGGPATIGVISAGEYEFGTATVEVMKIVSGSIDALLPGSDQWKNFKGGTEFTVEKNLKFKVRAQGDVSYLCLYK